MSLQLAESRSGWQQNIEKAELANLNSLDQQINTLTDRVRPCFLGTVVTPAQAGRSTKSHNQAFQLIDNLTDGVRLFEARHQKAKRNSSPHSSAPMDTSSDATFVASSSLATRAPRGSSGRNGSSSTGSTRSYQSTSRPVAARHSTPSQGRQRCALRRC